MVHELRSTPCHSDSLPAAHNQPLATINQGKSGARLCATANAWLDVHLSDTGVSLSGRVESGRNVTLENPLQMRLEIESCASSKWHTPEIGCCHSASRFRSCSQLWARGSSHQPLLGRLYMIKLSLNARKCGSELRQLVLQPRQPIVLLRGLHHVLQHRTAV